MISHKRNQLWKRKISLLSSSPHTIYILFYRQVMLGIFASILSILFRQLQFNTSGETFSYPEKKFTSLLANKTSEAKPNRAGEFNLNKKSWWAILTSSLWRVTWDWDQLLSLMLVKKQEREQIVRGLPNRKAWLWRSNLKIHPLQIKWKGSF